MEAKVAPVEKKDKNGHQLRYNFSEKQRYTPSLTTKGMKEF
jgi:hypothetical protein